MQPVLCQVPGSCQKQWTSSPSSSGRQYHLFDYVGAPDAERVIVVMGSGVGVVEEAVESLVAAGEKVGLLKVRLFRPWDAAAFVAALADDRSSRLPVLDRTKEPGAAGRAAVSGRGHGLGRGLGRQFLPSPFGRGAGGEGWGWEPSP